MNLNFTRQLFSIILIAFLCNTTALAQQKNTPTVPLVLVNRPVSPEMNLMTLESAIQQAIKQHHSAQFYLQIDQAHLSNQLSGIFEIQDQLKDTWVLARFTESPSEIQLQQSGITAWSAVQPHDKISKLLVEEWATGSSTLEVLVSVDSHLEPNEVSALFTSMSITLPPQQSWKSQSIWQLEIGEQALLKLAKHPLVRYISPVLADEAIAFQAKGFTNTQVAQQALALGGHN